MRVLALIDGTLADPDAPQLRVDDLGVLRGDGVFETILVVDGKPRELGPHLDRLGRVAADGSVLEGPTSTVVVADGNTLRTTPPSSGILPGTTQGALFRAAEKAGWSTKVEPLRVNDLRAADGLFLASSVRKITRVHTLDGEQLAGVTALHEELKSLYESEY